MARSRTPDASRRLRDLEVALFECATYAEWLRVAEEHDRLTGAAAWRADDASDAYDAPLLRSEVERMRALRLAGDGTQLVRMVTSSLYRQLSDVSAPELYEHALCGTKHLVTRWIDEVEASLRWLARNPVRGVSEAEKRQRFERAYHVYGRSALMLSGGATWGFVHLGVVKALFEHGALPHILSGASTGAMIAAGTCTRTDAELADMFANLDKIRLDGLFPVGFRRALDSGAWLDPVHLHAVLENNIGDFTFAEAFARSGRALNISVSPTRTRQKPQVLSHLTAPDVLVPRAAVASSALPGLFPPVMLEARDASGERVPYIPTERWVDGSLYGDLPKLRLARLHNVNHFIVSQMNPHIVTMAGVRKLGNVAPVLAGAAGSAARIHGNHLARLAHSVAPAWGGAVRQLTDRAHALVSQDYGGDIEISPRLRWHMLRKMVANPTREDLAALLREGELATWPRLPMITDQTRLRRVFKECVALLREATGERARADEDEPALSRRAV